MIKQMLQNERIVYAYDLCLDDRRMSLSVARIEFHAEGTQMTFTGQGAFLDGIDDPAAREHGTNLLTDANCQ